MGNQAHVRDSRQPGHFWADNEIVDDYLPIIGAYGFAVYMLLCKYADAKTGQCDPSVGGMAKRLQISPPTVKKALTTLEECGLISIKYRPRANKDRKVNDTNIYTLLAVEKKSRGTQGDWVPKEIGYGVPNVVAQGTQGDWVGVPNHVGTNNTQLNNTQLTTPTPPATQTKNGDGDGDEIAMLLDEYNIGASDSIAQLYREQYPNIDAATVRQSVENLLADQVPKGKIVNRLRNRPPEPGKPYQRSRASPKAGIPLIATKPVIPADVLTPAQIAQFSKAKRAERDTS
jgi:hypothetical protein